MTHDNDNPPLDLEVAATVALEKLRRRGHNAYWIGLHKYEVDGRRTTLRQLLAMANLRSKRT